MEQNYWKKVQHGTINATVAQILRVNSRERAQVASALIRLSNEKEMSTGLLLILSVEAATAIALHIRSTSMPVDEQQAFIDSYLDSIREIVIEQSAALVKEEQ